jgi:sigma-B regulation protein RsbU (phosphoserine phosphatase)
VQSRSDETVAHATPRATPAERDVLVVDDSAAQRRVLSLSLRRWGYRVTEAALGE